MLDVCAGRLGAAKAFLARGWDVVAVDLVEPPVIPPGVTFLKVDLLTLDAEFVMGFDFGWASTPCEEFSVWGMKNFHPNPKYPELGIQLFEHAQAIFDVSGIPYVMENVRPAQQFVGKAVNHCGSFYLWGNSVPPILPQGIKKGFTRAGGRYNKAKRKSVTGPEAATIPPELANCVAEYADRITEDRE